MAVKQRVLGGVERARILLMKNNSTGCQEAVTALEQVKELCSQALPQFRAVFIRNSSKDSCRPSVSLTNPRPGKGRRYLSLARK